MLYNIKQFVLFRKRNEKETQRILFLKKLHTCKKHKQKKEDKKKSKCNAGQPQVPERGRKVSREGKLMMKLSGLGLSSTSCLQVSN